MRRLGAFQITLAAAALAFAGSAAQAQQVGTASAVNPAATANLKTINIGQSIAHKERIQTKANGSVQLLFLDKTSMTIGPNSDLTVDEYVYDPTANTGKLAATLSKGALRFVGGQISHNGDAEIKTASALIGIRGGVMMTDGKGGIYAGYGTSTVTSSGQTVTLQAGEFTQTHFGDAPTLPGLPPPGFVLQQIAVFQSAVGQTGGYRAGGATQGNVNAAAQRATGSSTGSVTGSTSPAPVVVTMVGQINPTTSNVTNAAQTSNQATGTQQVAAAIQTARQTQMQTDTTPLQVTTTTPPPESTTTPPPVITTTPPPVTTPPTPVVTTTPPPVNTTPTPVVTTTPPPQVTTVPPPVKIPPDVPLPPRLPTVTLSGFASGLDLTGNARPVTGTSTINLDGTTAHAAATIDVFPYQAANPFAQVVGTLRQIFQFGGATGSSTYTNDATFSAERSFAGRPTLGGVVGAVDQQGTRQIGALAGAPHLTVCQCDYTRWGFWTAANPAPAGTTVNMPPTVMLGTWVAGRPVQISDVPTTGQATYTGHAIAYVLGANASQVIAAGDFSNTVNFGSRTGSVTVTNLDSTNYSGRVILQNDPRNFAGTLAGNVGNRTMALQGSFFQGTTSPVGEMGGKVGITGTNYLGTGIFAASVRH